MNKKSFEDYERTMEELKTLCFKSLILRKHLQILMGLISLNFLYSLDCEQPLDRWLSCVLGLCFLCVLMKFILLKKNFCY